MTPDQTAFAILVVTLAVAATAYGGSVVLDAIRHAHRSG